MDLEQILKDAGELEHSNDVNKSSRSIDSQQQQKRKKRKAWMQNGQMALRPEETL